MLNHNTSCILTEELTASLRRGQYLCGDLRKFLNHALGPPLRIRGERQWRHIDSHNTTYFILAKLLHIAPSVQITGAPANQNDVLQSQSINQASNIAAMSQVVVAVYGFGRIALTARINGNDTVLRGEIL